MAEGATFRDLPAEAREFNGIDLASHDAMEKLITALNTDFGWLAEYARYGERAVEWDRGGRQANRLLSGCDIAEAKAWVTRRPKGAPEPTALHLDFIRASEDEAEGIERLRSTHLGRDFSSIALLGSIAIVLIVAPNANVHSVSELVALAKSKPGRLSYGSVGAGTLLHLAGVLFAQRAGIQLLHVPYPGSPQAVEDVVAGRITMLFAPASSIIGQVQSGKVLALATAAKNRSSALPEVPTGGSWNAQFRHQPMVGSHGTGGTATADHQ